MEIEQLNELCRAMEPFIERICDRAAEKTAAKLEPRIKAIEDKQQTIARVSGVTAVIGAIAGIFGVEGIKRMAGWWSNS